MVGKIASQTENSMTRMLTMSEWRDFIESVELTDKQKDIYQMVCDLEEMYSDYNYLGRNWTTFDNLKRLLIEEFTGVKII